MLSSKSVVKDDMTRKSTLEDLQSASRNWQTKRQADAVGQNLFGKAAVNNTRIFTGQEGAIKAPTSIIVTYLSAC